MFLSMGKEGNQSLDLQENAIISSNGGKRRVCLRILMNVCLETCPAAGARERL